VVDARGAEIAVIADYDGTIATLDVTDEVVRLSSSEATWLSLESAYRRGDIGSRSLLEAETRLLPSDPATLAGMAARQPHDPSFKAFAGYAREHGISLEIVTDGLGFFVANAIAEMGLEEIPVYSAALDFGPDGPTIRFPNGHPVCQVCGTCKRQRVLAQQALGRHVVYVGDGYSDQYAVAYADTVFAKGALVEICRARSLPFLPWSSFGDIQEWLDAGLKKADLSGPRQRPFICGPEAAG
jgi:2-hydroxy-3-keto-5-methylthiopentenyl-1-phosphate phosphatase